MAEVTTRQIPYSQTQRELILTELSRVLDHPLFKNSRRCVALLPHLVHRVLDGEADLIKERLVGQEVFGREPSYDTSVDPVVRMTANEIRKRLAQCYQNSDHSSQVTIHLLPGSYIPEFEFLASLDTPQPSAAEATKTAATAHESSPSVLPPSEDLPLAARRAVTRRGRRFWWTIAAAALLLCLTAAGVYRQLHSRSELNTFWAPLLDSRQELLICMADDLSWINTDDKTRAELITRALASRVYPIPSFSDDSVPFTPFVDMNAATRLSAWIGQHGAQTYMRRASRVTLQDFRRGPTLVVGGFDNPWSLILFADLRFRLRLDPETHRAWVEDRQNPANRAWMVNDQERYSSTFTDYSIVTRYLDPDTGQWILAISGLSWHGIKPGVEVLTNPDYGKLLPKELTAKNNIQLVFSAKVINGSTGPPQLMAVYSW